jgi:diguanylate cyclase (GGDEF)-like protein
MTKPWETTEEPSLGEKLFPTEEAFPDHIKLLRYRSQLALGIALILVMFSFAIDLFDPPHAPGAVWTIRAMLLVALVTSFLFARSELVTLPRLYMLHYLSFATLAIAFALIIAVGKQEVLFTAFHTLAIGVLLRPLSGTQSLVTLSIVTAGAASVALGIPDAEGWKSFIPAMLVYLGTATLVQMVADMNFKLLVAEGEARQRMEEAMQKMNFLSSFDHLTRVMNRRNFEDALENALTEARAANQGLAYLEIDLDYFKQINDTYGHQAGDAVLRAASERIAACLRTGDLVGRMGGDEFAAAVKGATTDVAVRVAERILESFKRTPVRTSWGDIPLSCTIGIGCYPGKGAVTTSAMMAAADQSLYEAKEAGRGRVGRPVTVSIQERVPSVEALVPGVGMPSVEISTTQQLPTVPLRRSEPLPKSQRAPAGSEAPGVPEPPAGGVPAAELPTEKAGVPEPPAGGVPVSQAPAQGGQPEPAKEPGRVQPPSTEAPVAPPPHLRRL